LLAHGATPMSVIEGLTAPEYVAANNNLAMARELLVYREKFNTPYAIQKAVDHGHINMVLLFASHETDAGTALNMAAKVGNAKMVGALLANDVKIDAKNEIGYSALMTASEFGHQDVVNVILAHPDAAETVNQTGPSQQTALMFAARMRHLEVARALLAAGANINAQDQGGYTALLYAMDSRTIPASLKFINELLICGANTVIENVENTSVDFAKLPSKTVILREVREHIEERNNYENLKSENKSFFARKVKLSETTTTFFFPKNLVDIIDEYSSPTVKVKRAKKA